MARTLSTPVVYISTRYRRKLGGTTSVGITMTLKQNKSFLSSFLKFYNENSLFIRSQKSSLKSV